jgi:arabinofuranosyltransferase
MKRAFCFLLLLPALGAYLWVLYHTAWLNDDAYITYRVVDNFIHGYGLRWNVAERVQVYTHPLWMFLIAGAYAVTREMFLTAIFVSISVSVLAVAVLGQFVARNVLAAWLAVAVLISSRAFVDYSTSGLENPLTHLLLALFLVVYLRDVWTWRSFFWMCLIAALATLNRMDAVVLYMPALAWVFVRLRSWKAAGALVLGFLPLAGWLVFSIIYYGFPFPNTAYAKLGTGIDKLQLIQQGLHYYEHTLRFDPVTLPVIALGLLASVLLISMRFFALGAGIVLYGAYILWIGGDFMGGRFFAAPLFLAVAILVGAPLRPKDAPAPVGAFFEGLSYPMLIAAILWLGFQAPHPSLKTGADFGVSTNGFKDEHGTGDERRFWFQGSSLINWSPDKPLPMNRFVRQGREFRGSRESKTVAFGSMGFRGFYAGPEIHFVDYYALCDPLLARLPAKFDADWRIGHFVRDIPEGYLTTAGTAINEIQDPELGKFYTKLRAIIQAPLFDSERWKTLLKMNLGMYDHLIDWDRYRFPDRPRVTEKQLGMPRPAGTRWDAPGVLHLTTHGIEVTFAKIQRADAVELSVDCNDYYELVFRSQNENLGEVVLPPRSSQCPGLVIHQVDVPRDIITEGYDAIHVLGTQGDGKYALGHLRTLNSAVQE